MPGVCEDIDDIEDLIAPGDLKPSDRYNNKKNVTIRGKQSKKKMNGAEMNEKSKENNEAHESVSLIN